MQQPQPTEANLRCLSSAASAPAYRDAQQAQTKTKQLAHEIQLINAERKKLQEASRPNLEKALYKRDEAIGKMWHIHRLINEMESGADHGVDETNNDNDNSELMSGTKKQRLN